MNSYVQEIKAIKNLDSNEEAQLFRRFRNGDIEARNLLIKHNLDVVLRLAYKYNYKLRITMDDIINIGVFGLFKAINTYDESHGLEFKGFAFISVKATLNSYIRYWNQEKRRDYDDVSLQTEIFNNAGEKYELEETIYDEKDLIEADYEEQDLSETLQFILSKLTHEEQELLKIRFGLLDDEYRSCDEVGKIVGLDGERVRVKCLKAINKLKHPRITKQIKDFL